MSCATATGSIGAPGFAQRRTSLYVSLSVAKSIQGIPRFRAPCALRILQTPFADMYRVFRTRLPAKKSREL